LMPSPPEKSYRDFELELDLRLMDVDDKALSRVLLAKHDVVTTTNPEVRASARWVYYAALLRDVPDGRACECCGRENLLSVRRRDGKVVGTECVKPGHAFPCKRRGA